MANDDQTPNPFGPTRNPFAGPSAAPGGGRPPATGAPDGAGNRNPFGSTNNPFGASGQNPFGRANPEPAASNWPPTSEFQPALSGGDGTAVRPPLFWLIGGLAGVLAGALALLSGDWRLHLLGWLVAIVAGLGGVFAFTSVDLRLRASSWYISRQGAVPALRVLVTVGAVVVAGLDAWAFADWLARQDYFA